MEQNVTGSKGGATSTTPTQADDSLSSTAYAQILDLISEGPIYGPADPSGLAARSTYFDDTVVQNSDGTNNFNIGQLDIRLGTVDQTYISGFDSSSTNVGVGVELKSIAPWVHTITNLTLNAIRVTLSVNAISKTDPNTGNIGGYDIAYQVQLAVDGGSYTTVVDTAFNGKASSTYPRSHRIELNGAASQYTVRVVRLTANANSAYIQDTTNVVSYSELIDAKLRYPMSAVCGLLLDAAQFSSVPTRSYDMKGLLVKYPSNYNPSLRTYTGTWDGTFVTGWTDNPAWVFYDLVLNARYGAGRWVDATMIDRYSLYLIAQYCDVLVSDGKGGQEPRFTCNCYISSRAGAFKVLQDLASVFRGMAYWAAGSVTVTSDMPVDPAYIYTAANTIGSFKYTGSSLKTRYTCAVVTWNDPENAYQQAVEYVEDSDGVARYGLNKAEITAFACTSRGQAQRVGHWTLLTSRYETNTVTFTVGLDGTLAQPGQVISIADPSRAGKRTGGRIKSASSTTNIILDGLPGGNNPTVAAGDTLTIVMPSGIAETHTVSSVAWPSITVSQGFSVLPQPQAVWAVSTSTINTQLFRVATVSDKGGISFEIMATQHEPGKYAAIDSGAAIDVRPITGTPLTVQAPPTNVTVSQYVVIDQGIAKTNMAISWVAPIGAVAYQVQWKKDSGEWVDAGRCSGQSMDVGNIYTGAYTARVKAINSLDINSPYATSIETTLSGKTGAPPVVATLTATTNQIFAITLNWSYPPNAGDTAYSEVYYSKTPDFGSATALSRYSYPTSSAQLLNLAAGAAEYFWIRLVDTTGNIGAFYPASTGAGVQGQSNSDGTAILTYLTGQITATQLGSDLLTPIQAIPALQNAVALISATFSPPMAGAPTGFAGAVSSYAGVYSELSARADADAAQASTTDTLAAQLNTTTSSLNAAIQQVSTVTTNAVSSVASQITTVQAETDINTAAVQTNAQSYADLNGRVAASYTIKTQITSNGRTYIAGIGIGVDNNSGVIESQVLVSASTFSVLDPNGSAVTSPFTIQGGQVFISQALIGTGWITNAMIGNSIQSTAVGANGQPRWILDKSGTLQLNGANGGSGYMLLNDTQLLVYDANNVLRVKLGIW